MAPQSIEQLKEENRVLKSELERLEELLTASRAERDQIGIRYNNISERLEAVLKKEKGDISLDDVGHQSLVQQNIDLRRKLEEEHSNYKRKLQFYQDGQTRQAQLVQKLQAKVLQYKSRCSELEDQLRQLRLEPHKTTLTTTQENYESEIDRTSKAQRRSFEQLDSGALDLDATVIQLEGEQNRVEHLTHINGLLREQLDKATAANQSAMADLHKLVHIRDELLAKEEEWNKEAQEFNEYYAHTHNHLIELWQMICAFRQQFNDMKMSSEHELSHLASEFHTDTQNIVSQLRHRNDQNHAALEKEHMERSAVEHRLAEKVRELSDLQAKQDLQTRDLNTRNSDLMIQNERLRLQLQSADKDRLTHKSDELDGPSSLQLSTKINRLTERNNLFEGLRHVAQDLLDNCDTVDSMLKSKSDMPGDLLKDVSFRSSDLSSILRTRSGSHSPLRGRARSPSPKSDETASLVKRALQRSRQLIIELSSKVTSYQAELQSMQNQLTDFENDRKRLENHLHNLQEERDKLKTSNQDLEHQLQHIKSLLDATSNEKDRNSEDRQRLIEKIAASGTEMQKLKSVIAELQKQQDDLNAERDDLRRDLERQLKEVERGRRLLEQSEEKFSRLKEELVVTKESLNATQFRKDMAEHEKNEADMALARIESRKAELESELNKSRAEELNLRDALARSQMQNETLNHEKSSLSQSFALLDSEKKSLMTKITEVDQDLFRLRSDMSTAEREKAEANSQKTVALHNLKLAEKAQRDLEEELKNQKIEQKDLIERLNAWSRQKNSLMDELQDAQKEVKRLQSSSDQSSAEREQLTKDRAELIIKSSSLEKIIQQQNEVLSGVRGERDGFEADFYQLQQLSSEVEKQKHGLEMENQELLRKIEQFQAAVSQGKLDMEQSLDKVRSLEIIRNTIQHQLMQKDQEYARQLREERIRSEESTKQLLRDLELRAGEHENELERLRQQFIAEKSELIALHEQQINELNEEIENIQNDYDEQLIMIRNEKQQELADSEREKGLLHEKVLSLQKDLKDILAGHEEEKRERMHQQEQLQMKIENFQAEIKSLRKHLDDSRLRHETDLVELKSISEAFNSLKQQKETLLSEIAEFQLQLRKAEESRDNLKQELNQLNSKLKEVEEGKQHNLSEILNLKRALGQEVFEKDAAQKAANDLRNMIKKSEGEKLEQNHVIQELKQRISVLEEHKLGFEREAEDLRAGLHEAEKLQLELRRSGQELHRQVQMLDAERSRLMHESNSLRGQSALNKQNEEELRKEIFILRQKTVELEGDRETAAKEIAIIGRKRKELEDDSRLREKEFQQMLEESRLNEKSISEQTRHLEKILESANATIAGLRLQLSDADGKVKGLEEELAYVEGGKRENEDKLNIIVSCLQRTIGFTPLGSRRTSITTHLRSRSPSPRRSGIISKTVRSHKRSSSPSRSRSVSPSLLKVSEIKPEMIRMALQNLMQRFSKIERENNEYSSSVRNLTNKLQAAEQGFQRSSKEILNLQKALHEAEEVKHNLESSVEAIQKMKLSQEDIARQHENEKKQMLEKIDRLQSSLTATDQEIQILRGIQEKLKGIEAKAESEKRTLRQNLEEVESRLAKREVEMGGLEGEIQQMKQIISQKEKESKSLNQSLIDDLEDKRRQVRSLEEKLRLLEESNGTLNQTIDKIQSELAFHKNELHSGNALMQGSMATAASLQDRLVQLQRSLENSEHDRRQLQDRLEKTRHGLNEVRKLNHVLLEKIQELENQISNGELRKMELESQNKQSSLIVKKKEELEEELLEKIQKLQSEKLHLQESMNILQRNQANLDLEKQKSAKSNKLLEKDIKTLEKDLELERLVKSKRCDECLNLDRRLRQLDEDNSELQRQLNALQNQLDHAEQDYEQRLADLTFNLRREKENEIGRMRAEAEKGLEDHERSTRHRISSLENQILMLRRELELEIKKRQQYISYGLTSDDEMKEISSGFESETPLSELGSFRERESRAKYRLRGSGSLNKALPTRHDVSSQKPLLRPTSAHRSIPLPILLRNK